MAAAASRLMNTFIRQDSRADRRKDRQTHTSQVDGRPPVLTAISQSNGNGQTSIPHRIKTP